jgi:hypothetical protein
MKVEIDPKETTRAQAFSLWMTSPMPMVTPTKTFNIGKATKASKKREERLSRLLRKTIASLLLSILFGLLGFFSLMVTWLAYPVFAVFALIGAFMYGKFTEARKGRK